MRIQVTQIPKTDYIKTIKLVRQISNGGLRDVKVSLDALRDSGKPVVFDVVTRFASFAAIDAARTMAGVDSSAFDYEVAYSDTPVSFTPYDPPPVPAVEYPVTIVALLPSGGIESLGGGSSFTLANLDAGAYPEGTRIVVTDSRLSGTSRVVHDVTVETTHRFNRNN